MSDIKHIIKRGYIGFAIIVIIISAILFCTSYSGQRDDFVPEKSKTSYMTYTYGKPIDPTTSYSRLLDLYQNGHQNSYICASLELCGNSFYLNGEYAQALEAYTMALEMADATGNTPCRVSCYYCIGNIYVIFKDYERAAHYYDKIISHPTIKGKESTKSLAAIYQVLCYARMNKKEEAQKALNAMNKLPLSDKNIARYYKLFCTGLIEALNKNYTKAIALQEEAFAMTEKYGMKIGMGAYPQSEIGRTLSEMGNHRKAIDHHRTAMRLAERDKAFDQLDDAYIALDTLYNIIGMADSAHFFRDLHQRLSDSSLNNTEFYAARNKLINYEDGRTTKQIYDLEQRINILIVGIVVFLIVLAIFLFYNHKLRKTYKMLMLKNRQLIKEQDENLRLKGEMARPANVQEKNDELTSRISEVMNDTAIICDKDFSLQNLALLVGSNTKYVSSAINAIEQGGFKTLLNDNRIKEACRRLNDSQYAAYTIQAVAESVGYVSVNNFIIQFKRFTGMTPSVYRKMAQEKD